MLFFIDDSVVEAAEKGTTAVLKKLNDLFYCWEKGLCIIGCSRKNLIKLCKIKGIGNYQLVLSASQGIQSLYADLDFFIYLIYGENKGHSLGEFSDKYRELEITSFRGILDMSLNFIVCENVTDYSFYIWLTEQSIRSLQCRSYRLNVLPFNGGGSTTVASLKYIQNHFCLVICDSDVKYEGCKHGDTYRSIKDCVSNLEFMGKKTVWMYVLSVHEAENLVPLDLLEHVSQKNVIKKIRTIFSKEYGSIFLSFFDLKEGFKESTYRMLKNTDNEVFQKYERILIESGKTKFYLNNLLRRKYEKGKDNCIVCGLGKEILSKAVMYMENNDVSPDNYKVENYQSADWNEISRKIWSLGCAMAPKHI